MSSDRKSKPPPFTPPPPAVIEAHAVYSMEELSKRLRWKRHAIRQALRAGLRTCKFGSRRYCVGRDAIRFFERLAAEQNSRNTEIET